MIATDIEITRFFLAILAILFSAHLFGYVFHRFKMPKVIGEIFGGLLLGPTFLGYFVPNVYEAVFVAESNALAMIYWFGLVLLMFCSGFGMETNFDKRDRKTVLWITVLSTIIPFLFGWYATSFFDLTKLVGPAQNMLSLKIIIAIIIAVTSIPVISKIFIDLNILETRFAKIVLGIATLQDIILWVFLAIATGLVSANVASISFSSISWHIGITVVFFLLALFAMPRVIELISKTTNRFGFNVIPNNYEVGFALLLLLGFVILADFLHVNVIFGAFLGGIVVGYIKSERFNYIKTQIKQFSFAFFIPIYFAIVGMKLDLLHSFDPVFFIGFLIFASVVQGATVLFAAKILKYSWLASTNLAAAMNARGGPGIVIATIAFDLGIISESFFITLIMLAIFTSLGAGMWLRYVLHKGWKLL